VISAHLARGVDHGLPSATLADGSFCYGIHKEDRTSSMILRWVQSDLVVAESLASASFVVR